MITIHTSCAYVCLPFRTYDRVRITDSCRATVYVTTSPTCQASAISVNHVTTVVLPAPSLPLKERGQLAPVPVRCSAPCSDSPPLEPGLWPSHGYATPVEPSNLISTFRDNPVLRDFKMLPRITLASYLSSCTTCVRES